jgi:IclR family pca regulon transcriptional regulator
MHRDFAFRNLGVMATRSRRAVTERRAAAPRREVMAGLAKGLDVIRAFTRDQPAMTLSEVAAAAGLVPATARRCLHTLEELGYVTRNGRTFLLRPRVLELGAAYLESMNIEAVTRNALEDLARRTGDSAALTVLDGTEIVYVARASVRTLMRLEAHLGSRLPAYPTSMGRVLLSGLSRERLDRYFEQATLVALTDRTVVDRERLERLIADARRTGYAAVEDELAYGVVAVAVPVFDAAGRIVAALNSSSHSKKTTKARLARERVALLRELSRELSREIAHLPGLSLSAQL